MEIVVVHKDIIPFMTKNAAHTAVSHEYKLTPALLLGVLAQFDWTDEDDDRTGIATEGEGWLVGPYIVAKLAPHVYFQARGAWGESDNEVTPFGTYTDDFDTTRLQTESRESLPGLLVEDLEKGLSCSHALRSTCCEDECSASPLRSLGAWISPGF